MNHKELKEIRDHLDTSLKLIDILLGHTKTTKSGPTAMEQPKAVPSAKPASNTKEVSRKLPVSMDDPEWPAALPESSIVRTDSQKWARANTILTKFETIKGPILDFGCGEGHTTIALNDQDIKCIGYDRVLNDSWTKISSSTGVFTTDWDTVVENGPYESILLHDVLDHLEEESIEDVMKKVTNCLVENGRAYVMVHPYSSRHGGHLYEKNNKAYLHLLLTSEEIANEYPEAPANQRIVKPQGQYQKYLTQDFTIVEKKVIPQTLEPWVVKNLVPTIRELWYSDLGRNQVEKVLQIGGIYYTLKKLSNPV